jgi:hypothetical protein
LVSTVSALLAYSHRDNLLGRPGRLLVRAELLSARFSMIMTIIIAMYLLGLNTSRVNVFIIVVDGLNIEAGSVVGLESWETTICLNLVGASFTLVQSDVDILFLTHCVEVESCVVAAASFSERTDRLGQHGISVRVGAVEVCCIFHLRASVIFATNSLFACAP